MFMSSQVFYFLSTHQITVSTYPHMYLSKSQVQCLHTIINSQQIIHLPNRIFDSPKLWNVLSVIDLSLSHNYYNQRQTVRKFDSNDTCT